MLEGQFRIVISQRFIKPLAASREAIDDFFKNANFEPLVEAAWYRRADNIAVFDAGSTNILDFEGHLFPIDILPVRPRGILLDRILETLKIPPARR